MRVIFLKQNPLLGELQVEQTFLSYDGARLFSAINGAGQRFLINCVDADEAEEVWVAVAISERRFSALKNQELSLRDAFTCPELGSVIWFSTSETGELLQSEIVDPASLNDLVLPDSGVGLPHAGPAREVVNSAFLARALKTNIVLLRLFPSSDKNEVSAALMGGILSSFSSYLAASIHAAYARHDQAADPARVEPDVNVIGTFAGSLGVEFAVRGDKVLVGDALRSAVSDLAFALDAAPLLEKRVKQGPLRTDSMRIFLEQLSSAQSGLSVETASEGDEMPTRAALPLEAVEQILKRLNAARALDNSSLADEKQGPPAQQSSDQPLHRRR